MPVLNNPKHEQFAIRMAEGFSATKAYIKAGYSVRGARQSAHSLLENQDVSLRIAELTTEISRRTVAGVVGRRVADINARLREWQDRWEEIRDVLDAIIAERGEEMGGLQSGDGEEPHYVAGGSTGYIVKEEKGKQAIPVYRVDSGVMQLVRLLLDIGKRVALELGQWEGKNRMHILKNDEEKPDLSKLSAEELAVITQLSEKAWSKERIQ